MQQSSNITFVGGAKPTGLPTPTAASDGVPKSYVDAINSKVDILTAENASDNATTSATYVDLPGLTVTLSNLNDTEKVVILVNVYTYNTLTTAANSIQIVVDGVAVASSFRQVATLSGFTFGSLLSTQTVVAGLAAGTVIKVQCKTSAGTAHFVDKSLIVIGYPTANVI